MLLAAETRAVTTIFTRLPSKSQTLAIRTMAGIMAPTQGISLTCVITQVLLRMMCTQNEKYTKSVLMAPKDAVFNLDATQTSTQVVVWRQVAPRNTEHDTFQFSNRLAFTQASVQVTQSINVISTQSMTTAQAVLPIQVVCTQDKEATQAIVLYQSVSRDSKAHTNNSSRQAVSTQVTTQVGKSRQVALTRSLATTKAGVSIQVASTQNQASSQAVFSTQQASQTIGADTSQVSNRVSSTQATTRVVQSSPAVSTQQECGHDTNVNMIRVRVATLTKYARLRTKSAEPSTDSGIYKTKRSQKHILQDPTFQISARSRTQSAKPTKIHNTTSCHESDVLSAIPFQAGISFR